MNPALLSSKFGSYITPPDFMGRVHRFLHHKQVIEYERVGEVYVPSTRISSAGVTVKVPPPFLDPYFNDAALTGARHTCDITRGIDGNKANWGDPKYRRPHGGAFTFCNPEYGDAIAAAMAKMQHEGRTLRSTEIVALLPNRPDTQWCQKHVHRSADAWIDVEGRLTFWLGLPIDDPRTQAERDAEAEAAKDRSNKAKPAAFLRRWYPKASDTNLPTFMVNGREDRWRLLEPGIAVGPEVDAKGRPCAAPFPSLVAYWGDDVVGFAKFFWSLGTLTIAKDGVAMPPVPAADKLASCPPEVVEYVLAASRRKVGVYPSRASERLRVAQE